MADDDSPTSIPSGAHQIIATAIACSVLSTFFVAARIYTRSRIDRAIGWDDYIVLATLPLCIACGVLLGIASRYGKGVHAWDIPSDLREQYLRWIFIASGTYLPSLLGYKMSILCLYLRIFSVSRPFQYCTWAVMFITIGYLFSDICTWIFGCQPIAKNWIPDLPGHCILTVKADYGYGSLNFITDLLIFCLPLPMVWRMQLSSKDKLGVSVIFRIGSMYVQLPCPMVFQRRVATVSLLIFVLFNIRNWAVAIVRFVYVVRDLNTENFIWSIIEINTGLICACVPVLKPFCRELVLKTIMVRSWPVGKRRSKWTGDMLRNEGEHTHRPYLELENGKEVRSEDRLTFSRNYSSAPESVSNGTGALGNKR